MNSKIQHLVDIVYPNVEHEVQLFGDPIHLLVSVHILLPFVCGITE
jgi:hypothetical protein